MNMPDTISKSRKKSLVPSLILISALGLLYYFVVGKVLRFPCQPFYISCGVFILVVEALFQFFWGPVSARFDPAVMEQEKTNNRVPFDLKYIKIDVKKSDLVKMGNSIFLDLTKNLRITMLILAALAIILAVRFPSVKEISPVVIEFKVQSVTQPLPPGGTIPIQVTGPTLIFANVDGACALPCQWQAIKGKAEQRENCSTLYTPPGDGEQDALTIIASSPCKTTQSQATIFINSLK